MNKQFTISATTLLLATGAAASTSFIHTDSMNNMSSSAKTMSSSTSDTSHLKMDKNAKYKDNAKVTVKADHMAGMKNAKGMVVHAYDTPLYEVQYKNTQSGKEVMHHKWLVKSDFKDSDKKDKKGDTITITTDHMPGIKNAKGKIIKVHKGPTYEINYTNTETGKSVMNHKWITQDELKSRS